MDCSDINISSEENFSSIDTKRIREHVTLWLVSDCALISHCQVNFRRSTPVAAILDLPSATSRV
jgi:hypothetical protein